MQKYVLVALLGATSAIKIDAISPATTGGVEMCGTAPCPARAHPAGTVEMCGTAPCPAPAQPSYIPCSYEPVTANMKRHPPTYCPSSWVYVQGSPPTTCHWQCMQGTQHGPNPTAPTAASQASDIQDFIQGFFGQCDKDANGFISKKEMKRCLGNLTNGMMQGAFSQIEQMNRIVSQTRNDMGVIDIVGKRIWNGASGTTPSPDGISQAQVEKYLQVPANWGYINALMHTMGGGPGGDSGSGDSGYGGYGDSGYGDSGYGDSRYGGYGDSGYGDSGYGGYGDSGYGDSGYGDSGYGGYGDSGYGDSAY